MEWEYHISEISGIGDPDETDHKGVLTRMKALGKQAWELVSVFTYRGKLWAAYKRPVGEEEEEAPAAAKGARVHYPPRQVTPR